MKSLLLKDFYYLKKQLATLAVMVIAAIGFTFFLKQSTFAMTYMVIISSSIIISSISFDEVDNGYPAILALPISKKKYVQSKYFASILVVLLILVIMGSISIIADMSMSKEFILGSWLLRLSIAFSLFLIITAVSIPVMFKFGVENARVAIFISYVLLMAFFYGIYKLLESSIIIELPKLLEMVSNNFGLTALIILGIGFVFYLISYFISLQVFENKEF